MAYPLGTVTQTATGWQEVITASGTWTAPTVAANGFNLAILSETVRFADTTTTLAIGTSEHTLRLKAVGEQVSTSPSEIAVAPSSLVYGGTLTSHSWSPVIIPATYTVEVAFQGYQVTILEDVTTLILS